MVSKASRVWLITGANSGIGLALARSVLDHGDKVIATARDVSKIPDNISEAKHIRLNLNDSDEAIRQVALDALKIYGRIDVLVNNAGAGLPGTIEFVNDVQLKENFQTNVFGPLSLTRALIPSFREQKSGAVVTISSQGGSVSWPGFSTYCSGKVAFDFFMEGLGAELAPYKVHSLIIQPGFILTDWWTKADEAGAATASNEIYPHIPGLDATLKWAVGTGNVSDMKKCVERMYEFITETGEVGELRKAKPELTRLPLGMDCHGIITSRLQSLEAGVKTYEPITKSVNLTEEEVNQLKKVHGVA